MACERAVVATRAGGIPEIINDEKIGLLVPVRDPSALAEAIVPLLGDAARRQRYGQAGRLRAHEHFSAERMVDETAEAYVRLVGTTRAADTASRAVAD